MQLAFDANGTLFIAGINDGPLVLLRAVNYNPSNGGSGFEVLSDNSDAPFGPLDRPIMAVGPDGSGGQAVYVAAEVNGSFEITGLDDADTSTAFSPAWTPTAPYRAVFNQEATLTVQPNGYLTVTGFGGASLISSTYMRPLLGSAPQDTVISGESPAAPGDGGGAALVFSAAAPGFIATLASSALDEASGTEYVVFVGQNAPDYAGSAEDLPAGLEAYLTSTDDYGQTWTTPVRIDPSVCDQFSPTVTVDQPLPGESGSSGDTGDVAILYYTTDGDSSATSADVRPRLAVLDPTSGVWTYSDLDSTTSNANLTDNAQEGAGYGDYIGVAATGGKAVAIWSYCDPDPGGTTGNFNMYAETVSLGSTTDSNALTLPSDAAITLSRSGDTIVVTDNSNPANSITYPYVLADSLVLVGPSTGGATLTIDMSAGSPIPLGGLIFDGQGTGNALVITRSSDDSQPDSIGLFGGNTIEVGGASAMLADVATVTVSGGGASIVNEAWAPMQYALTLDNSSGTESALDLDFTTDASTSDLAGWTPITLSGAATNTVYVASTAAADTLSLVGTNVTLDGEQLLAGSAPADLVYADPNIHSPDIVDVGAGYSLPTEIGSGVTVDVEAAGVTLPTLTAGGTYQFDAGNYAISPRQPDRKARTSSCRPSISKIRGRSRSERDLIARHGPCRSRTVLGWCSRRMAAGPLPS